MEVDVAEVGAVLRRQLACDPGRLDPVRLQDGGLPRLLDAADALAELAEHEGFRLELLPVGARLCHLEETPEPRRNRNQALLRILRRFPPNRDDTGARVELHVTPR